MSYLPYEGLKRTVDAVDKRHQRRMSYLPYEGLKLKFGVYIRELLHVALQSYLPYEGLKRSTVV